MRRVGHVVAGVLCGALLAGCGGAPEASSPPSPSPSGTDSPLPDREPAQPAATKQKDEAGAVATVKWFLDLMDYAGQTGDTEAFRAAFSDTCLKCAAIADGIDRTYADGGSIDGGAWVPFDFTFYGVTEDVGTIDAAINYEAQQFIPREGADPETYAAKKNVLKAFQLQWDNGWTVGALDPEL